jgi:hypothetical protein
VSYQKAKRNRIYEKNVFGHDMYFAGNASKKGERVWVANGLGMMKRRRLGDVIRKSEESDQWFGRIVDAYDICCAKWYGKGG